MIRADVAIISMIILDDLKVHRAFAQGSRRGSLQSIMENLAIAMWKTFNYLIK